MKRPSWMSIKQQYTSIFPQLVGKVLILVLALLIVAFIAIGTAISRQGASAAHNAPATYSAPTPPENTISYANVQETAVPGSVVVQVTLAEFTIVSSVKDFRVGIPYHFIITNRGQQVHAFTLIPVKPDGTLLPPEAQYKGTLIEIEPIAPGTTMTINYMFLPSNVGSYQMACQMRGHYQAGMKLPVVVTG